MTTKAIGIKEFRNNITKLWKESRKKQIRYIVMYHSKPILDIRPVDEDDFILENFAKEIEQAREDVRLGKVYTHEEVRKKLGL
ncbi:MAG: hypothetical protein UT33_C0018G0012 [Candidatus Peregrinibacteria bacterium GW2011_GWC2_39_14]|nr:MAG: hypothetical protein US92_C0003G0017 [Candidatus Peregrinibacteria bacterium GW2011_GWA2_38_36]KKR04660.1 MAG: hypothetical protein UT33_C0018G0012 [Candidatus Peregrinibacteria bacterium GW2011_GWC2_39_14]